MNGGYTAEKRKKGKGGDVSIGISRPGDAMGIIWSQKTLKLERKPCDRTGKGPRRTFRRAALALAASLALTSVLPPPPAYSGGDEVHLVNDLAGRKDRYRANGPEEWFLCDDPGERLLCGCFPCRFMIHCGGAVSNGCSCSCRLQIQEEDGGRVWEEDFRFCAG